MVTNYIALARENRVKALETMKANRRPILARLDYAVYPKPSRRLPVAMFMSTRGTPKFAEAKLH
jgi:hypothetical protein